MPILRVVALMEAYVVTGPAKNLIRFCRSAGVEEPGGSAAEVSIATFYRFARNPAADAPSNQFLEALRAAGIAVDVIPERFRFDRRVIPELRAILRRRAPDIVQTHGVKAHFLLRFSEPRRRYRWIAFHHGYTAEDLKMLLYNQLNRWSLPAADRVVTVCGPFVDVLARAGVARERIRVLPNAIEPAVPAGEDEIRALRQRLGLREGERVVISIGRFSREKAQADLVPAAAHLARLHPDLAFRLVLVGDGPERAKTERAAREAGLGERILFAGYQPDVRPYYGLADLFVLPSHSEGSPNALLEAMAAGVPVVATAVGGVPETVADGESALLVARGDPQGMSAAMGRLLADRELAARLAQNAACRIASRHSPAAYRRALLEIYTELCVSRETRPALTS